VSLSGIKNYSGADLREGTESIDRYVGDLRVVGLLTPEFDEVKLYWETDASEAVFESYMQEVDDAVEDFDGFRLPNDARVSYNSGLMEYSSIEGDLSGLDDLSGLMDGASDASLARFAGELASDYRWIEK
jgi:hypothetical protein